MVKITNDIQMNISLMFQFIIISNCSSIIKNGSILNSGPILFNSLSCLDCQPGTMCEHFSMGQINYNDNQLKLASPKAKKTLKRSQKDSVVADKIKKPKVVPNVTLRRSLRNKK
ncbi:hypothetical protein M0804_014162 [Polistes exclamans]|nr:hypothetical protein M0804_014162 [Polistes exclamans]